MPTYTPAEVEQEALHVQELKAPRPPTGAVPVALAGAFGEPFVRVGPTREEVHEILSVLGEDPTDVQAQILNDLRRLILVAGGERAGKSYVSGLFGATRTPYGNLFWVVGPDYALARPEFEYWVAHLLKLGAIRSERDISVPKLGPCRAITKTGQVIETKTADDVKKLAAVAPDGIIMAEAAQHPFESYLRCVGRVAERRGWLLMSGTFEGSLDWYSERFGEWENPQNVEIGVSYSMPSWDNHHIYPGGRTDPEILRLERLYQRVEGLFEERIAARPVPPHNLVFREFRSGLHTNEKVRYNSALPVYLAIDPSGGTNPYSVLAVQFYPVQYPDTAGPIADQLDLACTVDEIYETGAIDEDMIELASQRPWWKSVRGGAIDVEAPDSRKRWMKATHATLKADKVPKLEGIRRLKTFLHYKIVDDVLVEHPHLQVSPGCKGLLFEFSHYKRDIPSKEDREMREEPHENQADHSLKALWYLLIARYGYVKGGRLPRTVRYWRPRR